MRAWDAATKAETAIAQVPVEHRNLVLSFLRSGYDGDGLALSWSLEMMAKLRCCDCPTGQRAGVCPEDCVVVRLSMKQMEEKS